MFPIEIFRLIGSDSYRVWKLLQFTCHDLSDNMGDFHVANHYRFYRTSPAIGNISYDEYSRLVAERYKPCMPTVYCFKGNFEYLFNTTTDTEYTAIIVDGERKFYRRGVNHDGRIVLAMRSKGEYKRLSNFIRDELPTVASRFVLYVDYLGQF